MKIITNSVLGKLHIYLTVTLNDNQLSIQAQKIFSTTIDFQSKDAQRVIIECLLNCFSVLSPGIPLFVKIICYDCVKFTPDDLAIKWNVREKTSVSYGIDSAIYFTVNMDQSSIKSKSLHVDVTMTSQYVSMSEKQTITVHATKKFHLPDMSKLRKTKNEDYTLVEAYTNHGVSEPFASKFSQTALLPPSVLDLPAITIVENTASPSKYTVTRSVGLPFYMSLEHFPSMNQIDLELIQTTRCGLMTNKFKSTMVGPLALDPTVDRNLLFDFIGRYHGLTALPALLTSLKDWKVDIEIKEQFVDRFHEYLLNEGLDKINYGNMELVLHTLVEGFDCDIERFCNVTSAVAIIEVIKTRLGEVKNDHIENIINVMRLTLQYLDVLMKCIEESLGGTSLVKKDLEFLYEVKGDILYFISDTIPYQGPEKLSLPQSDSALTWINPIENTADIHLESRSLSVTIDGDKVKRLVGFTHYDPYLSFYAHTTLFPLLVHQELLFTVNLPPVLIQARLRGDGKLVSRKVLPELLDIQFRVPRFLKKAVAGSPSSLNITITPDSTGNIVNSSTCVLLEVKPTDHYATVLTFVSESDLKVEYVKSLDTSFAEMIEITTGNGHIIGEPNEASDTGQFIILPQQTLREAYENKKDMHHILLSVQADQPLKYSGQIQDIIHAECAAVSCVDYEHGVQNWSDYDCRITDIQATKQTDKLNCLCDSGNLFSVGTGKCDHLKILDLSNISVFDMEWNLINVLNKLAYPYTFNYHLFTVIILLLMCELFAICWAQKKDRRYVRLRQVHVFPKAFSPFFREQYLMCLVTGNMPPARTSSVVSIVLVSATKSARRIDIKSSWDLFKAGAETWMLISSPVILGTITGVVLFVSGAGSQPKWYVSDIYIRDQHSGQDVFCQAHCWLPDAKGQGFIVKSTATSYDSRYMIIHTFKELMRGYHVFGSVIRGLERYKHTRVKHVLCTFLSIFTLMTITVFVIGTPLYNIQSLPEFTFSATMFGRLHIFYAMTSAFIGSIVCTGLSWLIIASHPLTLKEINWIPPFAYVSESDKMTIYVAEDQQNELASSIPDTASSLEPLADHDSNLSPESALQLEPETSRRSSSVIGSAAGEKLQMFQSDSKSSRDKLPTHPSNIKPILHKQSRDKLPTHPSKIKPILHKQSSPPRTSAEQDQSAPDHQSAPRQQLPPQPKPILRNQSGSAPGEQLAEFPTSHKSLPRDKLSTDSSHLTPILRNEPSSSGPDHQAAQRQQLPSKQKSAKQKSAKHKQSNSNTSNSNQERDIYYACTNNPDTSSPGYRTDPEELIGQGQECLDKKGNPICCQRNEFLWSLIYGYSVPVAYCLVMGIMLIELYILVPCAVFYNPKTSMKFLIVCVIALALFSLLFQPGVLVLLSLIRVTRKSSYWQNKANHLSHVWHQELSLLLKASSLGWTQADRCIGDERRPLFYKWRISSRKIFNFQLQKHIQIVTHAKDSLPWINIVFIIASIFLVNVQVFPLNARYRQTKYLEKILNLDGEFIEDKPFTIDEMWDQIRYEFYETFCESFTNRASTSGMRVLLNIRVRQQRHTKPQGNCSQDYPLLIDPHCHADYPDAQVESHNFGRSWDRPLSEDARTFPGPFTYSKDEWYKFSDFLLITNQYTFDQSGGYDVLIDMGFYDPAMLLFLSKSAWVDEWTKLIRVDMTIFNGDNGLATSVTVAYLITPKGVFRESQLLTFAMQVQNEALITISLALFSLMVFIFIIRELVKMKLEGVKHYMSSGRNIFFCVELGLCVVVIASFIILDIQRAAKMEELRNVRFDKRALVQFVEFRSLANLDSFITFLGAVLALNHMIKILLYTSFIPLSKIFVRIVAIVNWGPMLPITFQLLYAMFGHLLFMDCMHYFSTFWHSFYYILILTFNPMRYYPPIVEHTPTMGPLFFFFSASTMTWLFMEILICIVNLAFSSVKLEVEQEKLSKKVENL